MAQLDVHFLLVMGVRAPTEKRGISHARYCIPTGLTPNINTFIYYAHPPQY